MSRHIHIDEIKLSAASCPNCKTPIEAEDFRVLAEQTVIQGGNNGMVHYCSNCDQLMMVMSSSKVTVTLTTMEPKP